MNKKREPLVTVAITTFNYGQYIAEAIESVLMQSYQNIEILVLDDGSTDDTKEVIKPYLDKIQYIYHKNVGLPANRNIGLRRAKGKYWLALDADDKLEPEHIDKTVKFLEQNPRLAYVYVQVSYFGNFVHRSSLGQFSIGELKKHNYVSASSLTRTELIKPIGYDERFKTGWEDWDLYLTLAEQGHVGGLLDEFLLNYRQHGLSREDSINNELQQIKLLNILLHKHDKFYSAEERSATIRHWREVVLNTIGFSGAEEARIGKRLKRFYKIVKIRPRFRQFTLQLLYTLAPKTFARLKKSKSKDRVSTVLLARNAYSWQYGGAEQFTLNFAKILASSKIAVPVIVSRVPELINQAKSERISTVRNIWLRNNTRRRWQFIYIIMFPIITLQYMYIAMAESVDVFVLMGRDEQLFGTIAGWLLKKKVVWVDHGDMKNILSKPFPYLRRTYLWSLKKSESIVAVSNAERKLILQYLPSEYQNKLVVIGNGAYLDKRVQNIEDIPQDGRIISYIGRVEKEKGIYELLESAAIICQEYTGVYYVLAGKGRDLDAARSFIDSHGLKERVILLGHVTTVYSILSRSWLFVYPSHHDASPLAPAEALLAGIPVIASRVGGIAETVTPEVGILVPPNNSEALTTATKELLDEPALRARMAKHAMERANDYDFDWIVRHRYAPVLGLKEPKEQIY